MVAAVVMVCGMMTGCKSNVALPVNGTMESAVEMSDAPQAVYDAMKQITIDDRYETLMEDKMTGVAVYSLMKCADTISSEGYGMVVAKGDVLTALPKVRHGNMPRAHYDATTGDLWLLGNDIEGTGVLVQRPYLLRFGEDGYATIVRSIAPYDMQQALCKALSYNIEGQNITFLAEGKPLTTVTNHMEDMGGFMEDAIYIGEQLTYNIEGALTVNVTPGVNFVVGKILQYDDMPTITATVNLTDDGFTLSDFKVQK